MQATAPLHGVCDACAAATEIAASTTAIAVDGVTARAQRAAECSVALRACISLHRCALEARAGLTTGDSPWRLSTPLAAELADRLMGMLTSYRQVGDGPAVKCGRSVEKAFALGACRRTSG